MIVDTLHELYLRDQHQIRNGLKTFCEDTFGFADWSTEVWAQVDAANLNILLENRARASRNRARARQRARFLVIDHPIIQWPTKRVESLPALQEGSQEILDLLEDEPKLLENADFRDVTEDILGQYCGTDTWTTLKVFDYVQSLPPEERAHPTAVELLRRATWSLAQIERRGLGVDEKRLRQLESTYKKRAYEIARVLLLQPEVQRAIIKTSAFEKRVHAAIRKRNPKPITPAEMVSWVNVKGKYFYQFLLEETNCRHRVSLTPKGSLSSSKSTLLELADLQPGKRRNTWVPVDPDKRTRRAEIWRLFFEARQIRDMTSKYLSSLTDYIVNDRIHADFRMTKVERVGRGAGADDIAGGAGTGRLGVTPNLQNIKHDPELRSCFRAPKGYWLVEFDYDRIEPVVLAVVANVSAWKKIFQHGLELYRMIAADIDKLPMQLTWDPAIDNPMLSKLVPKHRRELSKVSTLAIMYDESVAAHAKRMGKSEFETQKFFHAFDQKYPEIPVYKRNIRRLVKRGEFVTTPFGRRRKFPLTGDQKLDAEIYRQAINLPIQGTASDITIWQHHEIERWVKAEKLEKLVRCTNIIHDSLLFEIHEEVLVEMTIAIIKLMEDMSRLPFTFDLPLRVTPKKGRHLGAMEEGDWWQVAA